MRVLFLLLSVVSLLAACGKSPAERIAEDMATRRVNAQEAATPDPIRFSEFKIRAMEAALRKEPKVVDLVHGGGRFDVDWQIGVHGKGGREIGYAEYVCLKLREDGLVDNDTDVRIVDIDAARANGGDFRAASLGHIGCANFDDLGV